MKEEKYFVDTSLNLILEVFSCRRIESAMLPFRWISLKTKAAWARWLQGRYRFHLVMSCIDRGLSGNVLQHGSIRLKR